MDKASIGGTPNGHEMRSSRTRAQLIAAAIDVFGRIGFEAASTRLLAKEGKANLSAIPYHFGGKRELYMAAAQEIADYAQGRIEEINVILEDPETKSPRERLEKALSCFLRILLDDAEPRSWTTFFARCAYENDDAFLLIHDRAIAPLQRRLIVTVKMIASGTLDEEAIRLRVSAVITAIIGFRLLRGIILRGMDWKQAQSMKLRQIEEMIGDLTRSNFLSNAEAKGPQPRSTTAIL